MANSNVSDEMLRALGRVTVNFQLTEMMLNMLTWMLISEDARIGKIITSNLSFSRVCDVFLSIVRLKADGQDELITEVEGLIKKASELEQERNTLVHSCYTVASATADRIDSNTPRIARKAGNSSASASLHCKSSNRK
jgi:hypothetical protein